jgi:MerR family transcriptional regulator, light-induced transcriptional regulator
MGFPEASLSRLDREGLDHYRALRPLAVAAFVRARKTDRSFGDPPLIDLARHLEALEPVLEFGVLHPMIDHLRWAARFHRARSDSLIQVSTDIDDLADFFLASMEPRRGSIVADALRAARAVALSPTVAHGPPVAPARWLDTDAFRAALLSGSRRVALELMNRHLDADGDVTDFGAHVIQPALYDIGQLWEGNKLSIADEHVATAIARCVMIQGALRAHGTLEAGPRIVLACAEQNRHEIGLQMVADAFRIAGWKVLFLGADVPAGEAVHCAVDWRADVLGVSVAFAHQMKSVGEITERLRSLGADRRIPVVVGGIAAARYPWLARAKGADAVAHHWRDSMSAATRLVGGHSS